MFHVMALITVVEHKLKSRKNDDYSGEMKAQSKTSCEVNEAIS